MTSSSFTLNLSEIYCELYKMERVHIYVTFSGKKAIFKFEKTYLKDGLNQALVLGGFLTMGTYK